MEQTLQQLVASSLQSCSSRSILRNFNVVVLLLLLLQGSSLDAQNCSCPTYSNLISEKTEDSLTKGRMEKLCRSADAVCAGKAYAWLGDYYLYKDQADTALHLLLQSEKLLLSVPCGDSIMQETYMTLAQLYYNKSEFGTTQEYTLKYISAAESADNIFGVALGNTMIAQVLNQTNQADKGIIYTQRAAQLCDLIVDPNERLNITSKLCKRYLWHYQDTKTETSLDSSELYTRKLLAMGRALNDRRQIEKAYDNLQGIAFAQGDYQTAMMFLDSARMFLDAGNQAGLAIFHFDYADILVQSGDYQKARLHADSALYYRMQPGGNPALIAESYLLLAQISKLQNDYKSAYEFRILGQTIKDSIRNVEKISEVAELERQYNQAKNEQKISELKQQQEIDSLNIKVLSFATCGAVLLLLLIGIFYRQNVLRNRQIRLETEQRLNRARMNPHFFFNTLSALQTSALTDKDPLKLADLLAMYSRIMRSTLESTYEDLIPIEEETEYLELYLKLQQFRTHGSFNYSINVADEIDPVDLRIPGMIIQPFVENAIEHGFSGITHSGQVDIRFAMAGDYIRIMIDDNGAGIGKAATSKSHKSRATEITRDRLFLINKKYRKNAFYSISGNPGGQGTAVTINLPVILNP